MFPPSTPPISRTWQLSDGYTIHSRVWPTSPIDSADELIIYLHGIQSHGGWFEASASRLADRGPGDESARRVVLVPDRRGSGQNRAQRGDVTTWQRWLDDLDELAAQASATYHPRRIAVVGISWGGKLAIAWALRRPETIARLLLVAPGIFPQVDVSWRTKLHIAWCLMTRPGRPIEIPLSDPALFTDNPVRRAFIANDPDKLTHASARFLFESRRLDAHLARTQAGTLRARTTLVLAERERIVQNAPTAAWIRRICSTCPTMVTLPGAHTLEFEPDPRVYLERISSWAKE